MMEFVLRGITKKLAALILILTCVLTLAGCAETEPALPDDGDYAKAGAIERMATLTENDIKYISGTFSNVTAGQLAAALNGAAEHQSDPSEDVYLFYDLTAYLSGGPEGYSGDDEQFQLYAGLEEDFVKLRYIDPSGDSEERYFSDSVLYRLLRDNYRIDGAIDAEPYALYRDIIEARAQAGVDGIENMDGASAFTGYEVTYFEHIDTFEAADGEYNVYFWDVAFLTDDPKKVKWAGGMFLDAEARVCAVEQELYFVVKSFHSGAQEEHRFLFWDLYNGPDEATGRENAREEIERVFADNGENSDD